MSEAHANAFVFFGATGDLAYKKMPAQLARGATRPAHYLAIPAALFGTVVQQLAQAGLAAGGRVIVEKPFGTDLASARALNDALHMVFAESAIFRVDHYLGKRPVNNILMFRFANRDDYRDRDHRARCRRDADR